MIGVSDGDAAGGGDNIIGKPDDRPNADDVAGTKRGVDATHRAVGGVAVTPDLGGGLPRIGDIGLEPVFPVVVIDDRLTGQHGDGCIRLYRAGRVRRTPYDAEHIDQLVFRQRHIIGLHRRRVGGQRGLRHAQQARRERPYAEPCHAPGRCAHALIRLVFSAVVHHFIPPVQFG